MPRLNRLLCFILLLLLVPLALAAPPREGGNARILFLNSYHRGYSWSDSIEAGIRERLAAYSENLELSVEYLDSRRFPDAALRQRFADGLAAKYGRYPHDLVMVSDNAAFDFAMAYRDKLFPGVPIVFCGYNDFRPEVLGNRTGITGVNEETDVAATVDLALKVHPGASTLAFILSTGDPSSRRIAEVTEATVLPRYRERFPLEIIKDASMAEIRDRLSRLPRQSLVFLAGQTRDLGQGRPLSPIENARLIAVASPVPVYGFWDFQMGTGVLGGHILTGSDQGREAANLAVKILSGKPVAEVPVVMTSPTEDLFDFDVMRRFHLSHAQLPATARVLNEPPSLWDSYRWEIVGGLLLLALETLLIVALLRAMTQRRHALESLEGERRLLEQRVTERTLELEAKGTALADALLTRNTLLDNALVTIALLQNRHLTWVNDHMLEMFGYVRDEVIGRTTEFLFNDPADYRRVGEESLAVMARGETFQGEFCYKRKDGTPLWCTISGKALDPNDLEKGALFVVADIDVRKRMERELQEANGRLALLAATDQLTGLANRRRLVEVIDLEISRSNRYGHRFAVILLDIDHFKVINDRFGHQAGDLVLQQVAQVLGDGRRKTDTPGRWGGEEFLIVCPGSDLEEGATVAELLRQRFAARDFGVGQPVLASFGVAAHVQGMTSDALLKAADDALYLAKESGRNNVRCAEW